MPSRPPHTTACTRSRDGSSATGMPRRMPSRTPSSRHGASSGVCAIPAAFDAWLHRLLVNACHDHARRTRRRPIELPALPIDRAEPRDDFAQLADRDELERAFLELSVEHRAVLVLTHYVGLPAPEVARILGIPPGTVASRLHYGARAMRAALGRDPTDATPATIPEPGR